MKQAISSIFIRHPSSLLPDNGDTTAFLLTSPSQLRPYSPTPFLCDRFPLHSAQTRSLLVKLFPHLLSDSHCHFSLGQPRAAEALPRLGTHTRFGPSLFLSSPIAAASIQGAPRHSFHAIPTLRTMTPMGISAPMPLGVHTNLHLLPNGATPQVLQLWLLQPRW